MPHGWLEPSKQSICSSRCHIYRVLGGGAPSTDCQVSIRSGDWFGSAPAATVAKVCGGLRTLGPVLVQHAKRAQGGAVGRGGGRRPTFAVACIGHGAGGRSSWAQTHQFCQSGRPCTAPRPWGGLLRLGRRRQRRAVARGVPVCPQTRPQRAQYWNGHPWAWAHKGVVSWGWAGAKGYVECAGGGPSKPCTWRPAHKCAVLVARSIPIPAPILGPA